MDLVYRQGSADDAPLFVSLEAKVENPRIYGPTLDVAQAVRDITGSSFFFICRDGTPVGTIAYKYVEDGGVYLSNVAVDPAHQGQGIARIAMEHFLSECRNAPYSFLVTHPENSKALALYQSLGFVVQGHREDYFGDGEPRLILSRPRYLTTHEGRS